MDNNNLFAINKWHKQGDMKRQNKAGLKEVFFTACYSFGSVAFHGIQGAG